MAIPESLIIFTGFVLAHAAWSISDVPKNELLVPMVMVERSGKREINRFETDTQAKAIEGGKKWIADNEDKVDSWVFAREGQLNEGGKSIDVLIVEGKSKGMKASIVVIQRFQPFYMGQFKLIGDPIINIDSKEPDAATTKLMRDRLLAGIKSHSKAFPFWTEWTKP